MLRRACVSHRIRVLTDTVWLSCAVHGAAHGGRLPSHRSNPQAAGLSRYKAAVRSPATSTAGSSSSAQKTGGHRPPLRSRFFGSRHCRAPSHTQTRQIFSATRTAALIWTSSQKPAPHDSLMHGCSQRGHCSALRHITCRPPHLPPKPHGVIPLRNPSWPNLPEGEDCLSGRRKELALLSMPVRPQRLMPCKTNCTNYFNRYSKLAACLEGRFAPHSSLFSW